MIIRIEAAGGSFRGAGKYYLHDKLKDDKDVPLRDQGDERVWFTDTRNTLNIDPERALDEMWRTAEDQAYLKMQAGVKRGGRVCEDPVKTISLSWHKEDRPDPHHMVESADAFLKHMGWDNHQAVYVGHKDTEHRHIHIILNRVDHETGRTLDDYRERKRAQVWALAYEKEHDNVRCEERELRAAKRERRAPELNDTISPDREIRETPSPQPTRTPANDHLPHNVVMLSRPLEREFNAREQQRATLDVQERAELKSHQRAEREAFFKDGPKLFKATRHAAYDEVRKAYKNEWRQFYKEAKLAGLAAELDKDKAVTDAINLALTGQWPEARERFGGREDEAKTVAAEFAARKADIEERQKSEVAERQRDACDALRLVRDVQYQELLQRQRNERAAWTAGTSLEVLGISSAEPPQTQQSETPANQNQADVQAPIVELANLSGQQQIPAHAPTPIEQGQTALMQDMIAGIDAALPAENGGSLRTPEVPTSYAPAVTHQLTDLAAGTIGAVASYLADQLGEMFAPTPPEVREAQAKANAKREADKPALENKPAIPREVEEALRLIEQERREGEGRAYWEDRDRGKGWGRDQ